MIRLSKENEKIIWSSIEQVFSEIFPGEKFERNLGVYLQKDDPYPNKIRRLFYDKHHVASKEQKRKFRALLELMEEFNKYQNLKPKAKISADEEKKQLLKLRKIAAKGFLKEAIMGSISVGLWNTDTNFKSLMKQFKELDFFDKVVVLLTAASVPSVYGTGMAFAGIATYFFVPFGFVGVMAFGSARGMHHQKDKWLDPIYELSNPDRMAIVKVMRANKKLNKAIKAANSEYYEDKIQNKPTKSLSLGQNVRSMIWNFFNPREAMIAKIAVDDRPIIKPRMQQLQKEFYLQQDNERSNKQFVPKYNSTEHAAMLQAALPSSKKNISTVSTTDKDEKRKPPPPPRDISHLI